MRELNISTWNRQQHFKHLMCLKDPRFVVNFKVNVAKAYHFLKEINVGFFCKYLYDVMSAINAVGNFKCSIKKDKVVHDVIHASPTIMQENSTFGFLFIKYSENLDIFLKNLKKQKKRILNSIDLFLSLNGDKYIHCSALSWLAFMGPKESVSGEVESLPEFVFSKVECINGKPIMTIPVKVNHALVDGCQLDSFQKKFQEF